MDNVLPFNDGAKILDLGCGPGTWIMDVATEYPNSEFIGVDMCDIFPNNIRPANVTFQVGNVLEGLAFEDNSFDMVSLRFFILAFRKEEWAGVLKEIRRVLKPGGFVLSIEPGMLEVGSEFVCWAGKICNYKPRFLFFLCKLKIPLVKDKMLERGQEPYISDKMKSTVELAEFEVIHCVKKDTYLGK